MLRNPKALLRVHSKGCTVRILCGNLSEQGNEKVLLIKFYFTIKRFIQKSNANKLIKYVDVNSNIVYIKNTMGRMTQNRRVIFIVANYFYCGR